MFKLTLSFVIMIVYSWLTYTDQSHLFSISYPTEWIKQELKGGVAFSTPKESADDKFQENVNVFIQNLPGKNRPLS